MIRNLLTLLILLLGVDLVKAEPLPWSFYMRFKAAGSAENIQLGFEPQLDSPVLNYINYYTGPIGWVRIDYQTETETQRLYQFGPGDWSVSTAPSPNPTAISAFDLYWGFQKNGVSVDGIDRGYISASGIFTSGTGNYWIDFDQTHDVTIDGKRALVRLFGENGESVSRINMTVTQIDTPEPATIVLAGVGMAALGMWRRRRIA